MHYHIIGIAGAGMSAIAQVLLDQGHTVSGSDMQRNALAAALEARGARVWQGHAAAQVAGADALVVTSAAAPDHVEIAAARAAGIPVLKRADLWREWSRLRPVVAVAGTHGKTTTTALIALILLRAGREPGFLIGGEVPDLGANARWGDPRAPLVIEADEYDRTFLALAPQVAVITNIEWDHVDIYPTPEDYDTAFRSFAAAVPQPRNLIICGDDAGVERALGGAEATFYGIDETLACNPLACRRVPLDWTATDVRVDQQGTSFALWGYSQRTFANTRQGELHIRLPGQHNVRNALAAVAAARALGVELPAIAEGLAAYRGAGRRFELKGEAGGVTVIDDYAHHPTEVRATLRAARERYPGRRLVVYLQPHTFSRTQALRQEWLDAFEDADLLRIGAIYAARETPLSGVDAEALASSIQHPDVAAVGAVGEAARAISALLRPGDVLLTLGAGDGYRVGDQALAALGAAPET